MHSWFDAQLDQKILDGLYSTCPQGFSCWELSHVIFLKLRKKQVLAKLSKFTNQLRKQFLLSQHEKNHVTQQPTTRGGVEHQN